ncbi:dual specificity mitogen-activated protein kinase kinase hemipterous-like isoform X2 [Sitodiplosis mosellana]|uniref:dual specificity mitogen-activated protein kinase kinase hemipterous-like isoform X2 n=1 Tax=Sitodiplosis mosellana TaxID=263140 RepID=UPI0024441912|nr:dual specificity mitogen-activated protein kinase kinase hemipterous-like isoform X2 [Sitodiplosis mosellana]
MSTNEKLANLENRFPRLNGQRPGPLPLPTMPTRPRMTIDGFPERQTRRLEPEIERKLKEIMTRSGIITIDGAEYKTDTKELDDLGELGNGTSGHVVKMRHTPTNKPIAVKQMRRTNNSEEEKRIIMDIDVVLKSHDCPYIVHCLGCFITEADVWICMELMATCFDKLTKKTHQPVPEAILGKITVATVKALHYLKTNHDVIHRDVKPSNILIDERGNIKLCDFGISGRLVDSKAKTRSAGCAAYMAPERIDPKKPEYDIRADVWSLGITLVELATGSFPYKGCHTDFEVLTCVLERDPPSLPNDQGFSGEFQEFVKNCLTKDYRHRPKYPELLESAFIKMYEKADVDVATWFASVMHDQQQPNNTEPRRQPSLVADKRFINQVPSSIESTTVPITSASSAATTSSSHIPIYQPFSHKKTNSKLSNGFNTEPQPSQSNPFQCNEPSDSSNSLHKPSETKLNESMSSMPIAISSPSFAHQFSPILSRTSSISERDSPLPMMPNFVRSPPHVAAIMSSSTTRNIDNFSPLEKTNSILASKSPQPTMEQTMTIPRNDEFTPRISNLNYGYPQPEPTIATLEHQRIEHLRQNVSPQMLHFQQIEERMVDQLNELYKATMMMHTNQRDTPQRTLEHDEVDRINQPYLQQQEPIYNPGPHNALQRNNSLSPFLQRKYSLQAHQQRLNSDQNAPRWRPQYGRSISATASPNLDAHRRYQTAIPVLETDRPQMVRLKGNTSPIVLQRFYHQQNQLREKEANGQAYNSPSHIPIPHPQPLYKSEYEKRINELNEKEHQQQSNPFLRQIPKLTHKLNPFKQQSPKLNAREEPLYANSHIPVYQKNYEHYDGVPKENMHRQRIPVNPPADIYYEKTAYPAVAYEDQHYPNEYKNVYNATTSAMSKEKKSNGTKNTSDDPGWFNSLAGIVKRRFASYVKSHLATSSGDGSKKDREPPQYGHPLQPTSPYHFDKLRQVAPTSSSMPSSPHFGNRQHIDQHYEQDRMAAHSPRVLNNFDRRHRSPDPPPRYNKGQSPLLLRRNLLEYGNHQVAPSPLLPRRYIISTSPPLPPPRKGSDSIPGSPQQLRARIHYTPEPQRRIYRTGIDQ